MSATLLSATLLLLACGLQPSPESLGVRPTMRYRFEVEGVFTTEARDAEGALVPEIEALGEQREALRGVIEQTYARTFRDSSEGHLVRFVDVERSAGGAWAPSGASGRSVELRLFSTGEILDIYEAEHVAGPERSLDVFDLLFPVLTPVVPKVGRGEEAWRRAGWPFGLGRERQLRSMLTASYENAELLSLPQGRAARLPYTGTLEGKGQDRSAGAALELTGEVSGEVFMRVSDGRMVDHSFSWSRTLASGFEATGVALTQHQRFVGRMTLEAE